MGKRAAQIRRMVARAKARGETYEPPEGFELEEKNDNSDERGAADPQDETPKKQQQSASSPANDTLSTEKQVKLEAAEALEKELKRIQQDSEIKSKERRSAKRRAEAIAAESAGCSAADLLAWFEEHKAKQEQQQTLQPSEKTADSKKGGKKRSNNPYIVFVGQLSYETTKESIFKHFQKELQNEHTVTENTLSVRLLTDKKTKKSRGMAFVQVSDPELLYACLKLHHTFLEGRRINVERSAGGKGEAHKHKIQKLREEQTDHCNAVVDTMLEEHYENHSIQKGEFDEGVIALAKRHSAAVVQAALEEYIEKHGRDMDNPSAYLTFLLGKMATEGIREKEDSSKSKGRPKSSGKGGANEERPKKKPKTFEEQGVDMSISKTDPSSSSNGMSSIFPSYNRGRGRASSNH